MNTFLDITNYCKHYMGAWYPVTRKGPTGPGHTTEEVMFDKGEDNKKEADWEGHEIKSCGKPLASRIRLVTSNAGTEISLHDRFAKQGRDGSKRFCPTYRTMVRSKPKINRMGGHVIDMNLDSSHLRLTMRDEVLAEWSYSAIEEFVTTKLNNLLIVGYDIKKEAWPAIRFNSLRSYRGLEFDRVIGAIRDGHIGVEFRVSQKPDEKVHDHGTAFFCSEKILPSLYREYDRADY